MLARSSCSQISEICLRRRLNKTIVIKRPCLDEYFGKSGCFGKKSLKYGLGFESAKIKVFCAKTKIPGTETFIGS